MKSLSLAALLFTAAIACRVLPAQEHEHDHGQGPSHMGGGYIPRNGPAAHPGPPPAAARHDQFQNHPAAPHVHDNGQWVGHDTGRADAHYHLDHPWEHGHFPGPIGREHVWRLSGGGPQRFGFNGYYFGVAPYDVGFCNGWNWNVDEVVIYDDPDHVGYYLAYNVRLGVYVHVVYL